MKLSWKSGAALILGGIILGGSLSSVAQDSGETPTDAPESGGVRKEQHRHAFIGGPLVRSEAVVEGEEDGTFNIVKADKGVLRSIDGSSLVIAEADGTDVTIPTNDETRFGRDGERAELGDLEVGDHIFAHRVKEGDADFVTKHVGAMSAERYAEMERNREACEDDDETTECERPRHPGRGGPHSPGGPFGGPRFGRGPGGPNGGDGDVEEAPEPATIFFEESAA